MNDNDNIKELIGARLEEIHLSETMTDTMPSDEEILRWETLADARRAQKQCNKRRLLSLAAVFLLAIVVGVAVIVSPPDAEAGGDGRALIVGNEDGLTIIEYEKLDELPSKLKDKFIILDEDRFGAVTKKIAYSTIKDTEQLEIEYEFDSTRRFELNQIKSEEKLKAKTGPDSLIRKEKWKDIEVHILEDPNYKHVKTYIFISNNVYVSIYTENISEKDMQKIIKEAF